MATYKDIQRSTGLSLSTISKYFNGAPVRPENGEAIQNAADELGFEINDFARGLRSGRSQTVGILVPSLDNSFILAVIAGVERALQAHGIGVLVCTSHPSDRDPGASVKFLRTKRVDGIVAVPSEHDIPALRAARQSGLPVVTIDHTVTGLEADHAQLNNYSAGAMAAQHLIDHGLRRIGFIGGDGSISSLEERRAGFLDTLKMNEATPEPHWLVTSSISVDSAHNATQRLLAEPSRPEALFAANYDLSIGALIAINESGLRVPDDLSFIGFDLDAIARLSHPRTTSVSQPMLEIAEQAARLMIDLVSHGVRDARLITLGAALDVGDSVRRAR